ncbi:unnamed protein product [Rotaria sp. Silwood2]|nr:unnamed protein product [Rotaria sp. Silwood2]CAF4254616.1 unnamed protein product [Rotaria sp. Silwood2]
MIAGFINGVLSLITFNNNVIYEVGCGLYLLGSSITTLLTIILLGLTFWILVPAQMSLLKNRLFVQIQCMLFDLLLREQFQQHKHLFTTHLAIVILGLPRVIIAFVSKCMKSTSDAWLFLIGYFIAFLPPMLTFVVFILPSNF